jgi:hypothetical protein
MMPKWLGWLGALVALVAVGGSLVGVSGNDAVMGLLLAGFLGFSLWLVIVSVLMLRRPAESAAAT